MTKPEPPSLIDRAQRRVVCAAIKSGDHMIAGPRHFDTFMHGQMYWLCEEYKRNMRTGEEGFIDQWGRFMNCEEAFAVATAAGQIRHKTGNPDSTELFSEDIY